MKTRTPMKTVNNFEHVYKCPASVLYYIFNGIEPNYYNAGTYGWNCDIYVNYSHDTAICTGYRCNKGKNIPSELIDKYTEKAVTIINKHLNYAEHRTALDDNINDFLNELIG